MEDAEAESRVTHIGRKGLETLCRKASMSTSSEWSCWSKSGRRWAICACSERDTALGGVWRGCALVLMGKRARLSTLHQMGMVLERASGMARRSSAPVRFNRSQDNGGQW